MKLALFLHAYQPPTQFEEITRKITEETYQPLIDTLATLTTGRITLNISGSLTEQLSQLDYSKLLTDLASLISSGTVELVGTAAFHPLLPTLPKAEVIRQNTLNTQLNSKLYEQQSSIKGFFLPEMFYEAGIETVIEEMGYEWILLSESAFPGAGVTELGEHSKLGTNTARYKIESTDLTVFFRDRPLSLMLAFDHTLTIKQFVERMKEHIEYSHDEYVILAVDAETFGHHIKGNLPLLKQILDHDEIEAVTISELLQLSIEKKNITPVTSTWGQSKEDVMGRSFPRWMMPGNKIHTLQWELYNVALKVGEHQGDSIDTLDRAVHSDQFWWASGSPCWHVSMVERGAEMLRSVVTSSDRSTQSEKNRAGELYEQIMKLGVETYGTKVIAC